MLRIVAPHFVAGLIHHDGRVVEAAPILRFMVGWSGRQVAGYCARRGWAWERVKGLELSRSAADRRPRT